MNIGTPSISKKSRSSPLLDALERYVPHSTSHYLPERAAHFIDYMTRALPYEFIPYNIVVYAARGTGRIPSPESPDVAMLKTVMRQMRTNLWKTYSKDLVTKTGYGVRATVGEDDRVDGFRKRCVRVRNAADRAREHGGTIDADYINDDALALGVTYSRRRLVLVHGGAVRVVELLAAPVAGAGNAQRSTPPGGKARAH